MSNDGFRGFSKTDSIELCSGLHRRAPSRGAINYISGSIQPHAVLARPSRLQALYAGAFCLASLSTPVYPATVDIHCSKRMDGELAYCDVLLTGRIARGDSDKLLRVITNPPAAHLYFHTVVLESPGGDAAEALKLADLVGTAMLRTSNIKVRSPGGGNVCSSACVLVLMGGVARRVFPDKRMLGLHRPYFSKEDYSRNDPSAVAQGQSQIMQRLRGFLQDGGMATELVDKMMRHSSRDIYWVDSEEWKDKVSAYAPWYEETIIARCNLKSDQAAVLKRRRDDYSEVLELMGLSNCEDKLRAEAQQKLRGSSPAERAR